MRCDCRITNGCFSEAAYRVKSMWPLKYMLFSRNLAGCGMGQSRARKAQRNSWRGALFPVQVIEFLLCVIFVLWNDVCLKHISLPIFCWLCFLPMNQHWEHGKVNESQTCAIPISLYIPKIFCFQHFLAGDEADTHNVQFPLASQWYWYKLWYWLIDCYVYWLTLYTC